MEEFDEMLRRMAEKEECTVPKGFDERLQETLDGLPSRRKKRRGLGVLKGAAVAAARRGGLTATYDELNKFFAISGMPIASG